MLIGHELKEEDFKNAVALGTLRHAYLFFGDAHIGKYTFAVSFANFLENGVFDVPKESLLDTRVFSKNEKGIISIDEARELKKFLSQRPFKSQRKIAIIDDAEMLTEEAQSSLLKTVEEPPLSSLIIFIAPSENVFFQPLVSRLSKIYFSRVATDTIERHLRMFYTVDARVARDIAARAFGRIGIAVAHVSGNVKGIQGEESLAEEIDRYVQAQYHENVQTTSEVLEKLILKESECRRFNLNPSLQKKAVAAIMQKKYGRYF